MIAFLINMALVLGVWLLLGPHHTGDYQLAVFGFDDLLLILAATGAVAGGAGGLIQASKAGSPGVGALINDPTPSSPALRDLLGARLVVGKRGAGTLPSGGSVFGPNYELLRGALQDIFNPGQLNTPESLAFGIGNRLGETTNPVQSLFARQILPGLQALAKGETTPAFRTDLTPVIRQAKKSYAEDFLPALVERVSPTFSDFGTLAGREGRRIATDLGALDVQYNNPAQILANLTQGASLGAATAALPLNLISDLLSTGGQLRGREELGSRNILQAFQSLSGIPTTTSLLPYQNPSATANFLQATGGINTLTQSLNNLRDFSKGITFGQDLSGIPPASPGGPLTTGTGTAADPFRLAS